MLVCILLLACDAVTNIDDAIRYCDANQWQFDELVSDLKSNISIKHVDPNLDSDVIDSYRVFDKSTEQAYRELQKKLSCIDIEVAHSMRDQQVKTLDFKGAVFTMFTPSAVNHQLIEIIYLEGHRDIKSFVDEENTSCKKINDKGWYACSTGNMR